MPERRVNGIAEGDLSVQPLSGARRNSEAATNGSADEPALRTLENLRRRRASSKARTLDGKGREMPVVVGERERRLYPLAPGDIDYIESRGNYVEFHADDLVFISRDTITRLAEALAASSYIRIHRTLLVNIKSILYVQRRGHGSYEFTLSSGARLCSARRFRSQILRVLPLAGTGHPTDSSEGDTR